MDLYPHQEQVADEPVDWDIDANLPLYTRDYLKMAKEKFLKSNQPIIRIESEPVSALTDELTSYLDKFVKEVANQFDHFCALSLLDPQRRGVLVIQDNIVGYTHICLDESVPFGSIHVMREDQFVAGPVPPPVKGGRRT